MNIIGEGIQDFVSNQIKTRQIAYGSGGVENRTLEQIEYLNAKTSFAKLVSSVDLEARFNPASKELQAIKKVYGSNELAKEFILFNGTTDVNNQHIYDVRFRLSSGASYRRDVSDDEIELIERN